MRQERAEAVQLARQAGIRDHEWLVDQYDAIERLVRLAKDVEREACAKVCEELPISDPKGAWFNNDMTAGASECATAIRARKC